MSSHYHYFLCQFFLFFTFILFQLTFGHGIVEFPPQRCANNPKSNLSKMGKDTDAPIDYKMHFPAGDKDNSPGAAKRSQEREVDEWVPFEPLKKGYKWRAGVCGDEKNGKQEHQPGGKYYCDGKVVAEYSEGGVIDIHMHIVTNHGGFAEFHLCDIKNCQNKISEECFQNGHCYALERVPNDSCETGTDPDCNPIDPSFKGRWYFPCTKSNQKVRLGGKKMQYRLPKGVSCEHCVLHWYWGVTNGCYVPGQKAYYHGPHGPKNKGTCPGNGGGRGELRDYLKKCGGRDFTEDYYECIDIAIKPSNGEKTSESIATATPEIETLPTSKEESDTTSLPKPTETPVPDNAGNSMFSGISVIGDDEMIAETVKEGEEIDVSGFEKIALEAKKTNTDGPVKFYINGKLEWTDYNAPFFLFGNRGRTPTYRMKPPVNEKIDLMLEAPDGTYKISFTLKQNDFVRQVENPIKIVSRNIRQVL